MTDAIRTYGPNVPVSNVVIPKEGPRALACTLNFTNTATIDIEGLLPTTTGRISYIQGVYVDNADNSDQLILVAKTTQQRLVIPAYAQGYWPILFAQVPDMVCTTTQAAIRVYMHFYNVPIQSQYWLANDAAPSGVSGLTNAELRATPLAAPIGGAWTNGSIANLSGASQTLFAANTDRRHLVIQNIAANSMGVNLAGGTAAIGTAGTITLTAGAMLELFNYPPTSAITIIGTANDDVTAFEG